MKKLKVMKNVKNYDEIRIQLTDFLDTVDMDNIAKYEMMKAFDEYHIGLKMCRRHKDRVISFECFE